MKHAHFSAFLLLVLSMMFVLACDDEVKPAEQIADPITSDFDWIISFEEVSPISAPIANYTSILLPVTGAFDLIKVDTGGVELWRKSFDSESYNAVTGMSGTAFLATAGGETHSFIRQVSDLGNLHTRVEIDSVMSTSGIARTPNRTAFVAGTLLLNGHRRTATAAFDSDLNMVSYNVLSIPDDYSDWPDAILATSDNGCLVFGHRIPDPDNEAEPYGFVAKLNSEGQEIWNKVLVNADFSRIEGVVELENGDAIIAGDLAQELGSFSNPWLMRITATGDEVWSRVFQMGMHDSWLRGIAMSEQGIIVAGSGKDEPDTFGGPDNTHGWLALYDIDGRQVTTRRYEGHAFQSAPVAGFYGGYFISVMGDDFYYTTKLAKLKEPIFPTP